MASIKDVAIAAGVSTSTVSRIINENPAISAETREKVLKIMKDLDYVPNSMARALSNQRAFTVTLAINADDVKSFNNPFFYEVMHGIEKVVYQEDLCLIIANMQTVIKKENILTSGISQYKLGVAIAIAVAIHNIPEGIAVAIPVYCATGSRRKAFFFSLLSGITEPLGAVVAFIFLAPFISEMLLGILFSAVAGIMVYISFDELLPTAQQYGEHHMAIYGLFTGMLVMGVTIQILL